MTHQEAITLIQHAQIRPGDTWVDLGAGQGRFSLALAELLGQNGLVYAIDKDMHALRNIPQHRQADWAEIRLVEQDFLQALPMIGVDGILMANALHYVRDQAGFLSRLRDQVGPTVKLLLIEYDTNRGNPWVPYPISFDKFGELARQVDMIPPEKIARHQSRYGYREMYAAVSGW